MRAELLNQQFASQLCGEEPFSGLDRTNISSPAALLIKRRNSRSNRIDRSTPTARDFCLSNDRSVADGR
jgi:hypothetical protein